MQFQSDQIPWWIRVQRMPRRVLSWLAGVGAALIWPVDFLFFHISRKLFGTLEKVESAEFVAARSIGSLLGPLRFLRRLLRGLLRGLAAAVIWPVEFVLFSSARKAFAIVDAFEYVGFVARRLRWAVLRPFRRVRHGLGWLVAQQPRYVRKVLYAPFVAVARLRYLCVRGFVSLVEVLNLDGVLLRLVRWTRPVWYPLVAVTGFIWIWCVTRSKRQLLWGIPVVGLVLACSWIAGERAFKGDKGIAANYRIALNNARTDKDQDRMQLFMRKLAQLGADTQIVEFRAALALAKDGQYMAAYDRMRKLAPEDKPGFPMAHFWIVESIVAHQVEVLPGEGHRLIGLHLDQLDSLGIKAAGLDVLRAYWLVGERKSEEATALLKPLIHEVPSAAIDRMRLDLKLNRLAEARQDALAVTEHMERAQRKGDSLTVGDYQWWAIAEDVLEHRVRFRAVVAEWLSAYPNSKQAREALALVSRSELEQALSSPDHEPEAITRQILDVFANEDVSEDIKKRVAELYHRRAENPALVAVFDNLMKSADLSAALAQTLGTEAAVEGDLATAKLALERAVHQDPSNSVAWNNLAFVLFKQGTNLDKALSAADRALELNPDGFRIRETRGQILVKLQRWREAIADLEFALNGMPDSAEIHRSLAEAYAALGNRQLAAVHRQYAN